MDALTVHKVREISADQLGLPTPSRSLDDLGAIIIPRLSHEAEPEQIDEDDPYLTQVIDALAMGFAGAILVGPPGTGKSYYAKRIASYLAEGHSKAVRFVQFHASYQYEDFMEGYAPSSEGGFERSLRTFPLLCQEAAQDEQITHVLVIDEISRVDATRIFGEALTYIEVDKRGMQFTLASGSVLTIPKNVVIIATMNPWDKGVDEVDIAFERRFAHIDMPPNANHLRAILESKEASPEIVDRVVSFFERVQGVPDEACHLGHAYFLQCLDARTAALAWKFRIGPFFNRACRLDRALYEQIEGWWTATVGSMVEASDRYEGEDSASPVVDSEG